MAMRGKVPILGAIDECINNLGYYTHIMCYTCMLYDECPIQCLFG